MSKLRTQTVRSSLPEELLASVGAETRPSPLHSAVSASPRPARVRIQCTFLSPLRAQSRAQSVAIIFMQIISQHPHTGAHHTDSGELRIEAELEKQHASNRVSVASHNSDNRDSGVTDCDTGGGDTPTSQG